MRVLSFAILPLLVTLASCKASEVNKNNFIFNHDLLKAYENYDQELIIGRSELMFSNKKVVKNCAEYFMLFNEYKIDEFINNTIIKNEYLICDALNILSRSSNLSGINENHMGKKLSSKLDLRTFRSSLFRLSDEKKHTLKLLYPKNITDEKFSTVLETEDWVFRLEVVAIIKVNNNEIPDWIVWVFDEAKLGSYRAYTTLILYDVDSQNKYIATSYPKKL